MTRIRSHARVEATATMTGIDPATQRIDVQCGVIGPDRAALTSLTCRIDGVSGAEFSGNGLLIRSNGEVGRAARNIYSVKADDIPVDVRALLVTAANEALAAAMQRVNQ